MTDFGFQGGKSSSGGGGQSFTTVIATTNGGRQLITHGLGRTPKLVTFFYNGTPMLFEYYTSAIDVGSDPLINIVLVSDQVYVDLQINFL
jgi:hypothetical protein